MTACCLKEARSEGKIMGQNYGREESGRICDMNITHRECERSQKWKIAFISGILIIGCVSLVEPVHGMPVKQGAGGIGVCSASRLIVDPPTIYKGDTSAITLAMWSDDYDWFNGLSEISKNHEVILVTNGSYLQDNSGWVKEISYVDPADKTKARKGLGFKTTYIATHSGTYHITAYIFNIQPKWDLCYPPSPFSQGDGLTEYITVLETPAVAPPNGGSSWGPEEFYVNLKADPSVLGPGKMSTITVDVSYKGKMDPGRKVDLINDGGYLEQTSGVTDANGRFTTNFTAPEVNTYTITAKSERLSEKLTASDSVTITVPEIPPGGMSWNIEPPKADFRADITSGSAPLIVKFTDISSGGPPTEWQWNFGDTNTSNQQHPLHVYKIPGKYTVSLYVSNNGGHNSKVLDEYISVTEPERSFLGHVGDLILSMTSRMFTIFGGPQESQTSANTVEEGGGPFPFICAGNGCLKPVVNPNPGNPLSGLSEATITPTITSAVNCTGNLSCKNEICNCMCTDLTSDSTNCGQCGVTCPRGQICSNGACGSVPVEECGAGFTNCNGACVDRQSDPANCGQCGVTCPRGQICLSSTCIPAEELRR